MSQGTNQNWDRFYAEEAERKAASKDVLRCGRSRRNEPHNSHTWNVQATDDSPEIITVVCPGALG